MGIPSAIFQVAAIFGRRLLPPNLAVSFFSKKPMPLPQKKLIPTIFLLLVIAAIAAPPLWWSSGNPPIIVANAPQNNRGPANIGQAKHIAKSAIAALRPILPAVATQIEADLAPIVDFTVPNPKTPEWIAKQKAPLLLGQLKAMADPFYRRLNTAAPTWLTAERTANGTRDAVTVNYFRFVDPSTSFDGLAGGLNTATAFHTVEGAIAGSASSDVLAIRTGTYNRALAGTWRITQNRVLTSRGGTVRITKTP